MLTVITNTAPPEGLERPRRSERTERAQAKLQSMIDTAREQNGATLDRIFAEVPRDRLVPSNAVLFSTDRNRLTLELPDGPATLHPHALTQAATRPNVSIPLRYVDDLLAAGEWGTELVAQNLNELYRTAAPGRFLVRSVNGEVRGFLSDRYRRLDTAPIVEAMIAESGRRGAVIWSVHGLQTKWRIRLLLPDLFEPIPGEVVAYGLSFGNSDYGDGALHIASFILRVWCTNGAVGEDVMRQVHIGRKLTDDADYSQRTYRLDTATTVSAVRDLTRSVLSVDKVSRTMRRISDAASQEVDARKAIDSLRKRGALTKTESDEIAAHYNTADIEEMPAGPTRWRLSNAISLLARNRIRSGDERRGDELQELAGTVLEAAA